MIVPRILQVHGEYLCLLTSSSIHAHMEDSDSKATRLLDKEASRQTTVTEKKLIPCKQCRKLRNVKKNTSAHTAAQEIARSLHEVRSYLMAKNREFPNVEKKCVKGVANDNNN